MLYLVFIYYGYDEREIDRSAVIDHFRIMQEKRTEENISVPDHSIWLKNILNTKQCSCKSVIELQIQE